MARLDREVRQNAANATQTQGCNYCHRQKPKDQVEEIQRGHGRKGHICRTCKESRDAARKKRR